MDPGVKELQITFGETTIHRIQIPQDQQFREATPETLNDYYSVVRDGTYLFYNISTEFPESIFSNQDFVQLEILIEN